MERKFKLNRPCAYNFPLPTTTVLTVDMVCSLFSFSMNGMVIKKCYSCVSAKSK